MSYEQPEYYRTDTRVQISDDELRELLTKHQRYVPLTKQENANLWQFIANYVRNLERRFFGKQDASKDLDVHHERILYVFDYLRERRKFVSGEQCELLSSGKVKCRHLWVPSDDERPPFQMLYRLKRGWSGHEAMIRLRGLGIDFSNFGLTGLRNRFEIGESKFVRTDVVSTLAYLRRTEDYNRDSLINSVLAQFPETRRFRRHKYIAEEMLGVEPFVDTLLFAIGHRSSYAPYDNNMTGYDYFKTPEGSKGRRIWTQSLMN